MSDADRLAGTVHVLGPGRQWRPWNCVSKVKLRQSGSRPMD